MTFWTVLSQTRTAEMTDGNVMAKTCGATRGGDTGSGVERKKTRAEEFGAEALRATIAEKDAEIAEMNAVIAQIMQQSAQQLEAVHHELLAVSNARVSATAWLPNLRCSCRQRCGHWRYVAAATLMGVVAIFIATEGTFKLWDMQHSAATERYHTGKARREALDTAFRARANSTAGHRVPLRVELASATPRVWRIPNFVSDSEADFIVDAYGNLPFPFTYIGGGGRVCDDFTYGNYERTHNRVLAAVVDRMDRVSQDFSYC